MNYFCMFLLESVNPEIDWKNAFHSLRMHVIPGHERSLAIDDRIVGKATCRSRFLILQDARPVVLPLI